MEFQVEYLALFLLFSVIDGFKWFWMESPHKNILLKLEFLKAPFLVLHYRHLIYGNTLNWLLNLNLIYETLDLGKKWVVYFNTGKM